MVLRFINNDFEFCRDADRVFDSHVQIPAEDHTEHKRPPMVLFNSLAVFRRFRRVEW